MAVKRIGPTHRQRQALATRAQVAAAARELFTTRGYVATTIAAIAERADIPAPTIYSAFGTKARILREIAESVMAGLDVADRHRRAREHPDPVQGLRLAAGMQRWQYEAMYDVITVFQEAARTDPEIAARTATILATRDRWFRMHVEAIAAHLAPGLDVDRAVDLYTALVLPEVWRTLVVERGWTPQSYEDWLAGAFARELLGR